MESDLDDEPTQGRSRWPGLRNFIIFAVISAQLIFWLPYIWDPYAGSSSKEDDATLEAQTLCTAYNAYELREGKPPTSIQSLKKYLESNSVTDPWGNEYQLGIRKNQETGVDEPVVWTVSPHGKRIQWPRQ